MKQGTIFAMVSILTNPMYPQYLSMQVHNKFNFFSVQFIKDKNIKLSEKKYHEELIKYSKENLMLYPYHLSKMIVRGLDITPFQYYYSMLENIMEHERSYDSLPNFTAADCKYPYKMFLISLGTIS
jgi:hypothetical protein